jgi:3-dehydroquinate synthase
MDFDLDRNDIMKVFPSPLGDIYLGKVQDGLSTVISSLHVSNVFVVADVNTAKLCLPQLHSIAVSERVIVIPSGEKHKNLDSCGLIWSFLVRQGADRYSLVLNVGGGMICDLGGFAASCFQRGIPFGHVPTSVLAMSDAAIGGKNGVDFEGFKNYIGRFQPPAFIWIDPVFINTLPQQEIREGFAEIIKHAVIGSKNLWDILEELENLDNVDWHRIFEENTPFKKQIAEADPHEKGLRKVLNFGHTIGHALESHFLRTPHPISHGQAVTLGMLAELKIAQEAEMLSDEDFQRIVGLIHRLLGQVEVTLPSIIELQHWIEGDKKRAGGQVGYSLPDKIGSCRWDVPVDRQIMVKSFDWLSTQVRTPAGRLSEEK